MRKFKFFLKYNLIFFAGALSILFLFIQHFNLYFDVGFKKIELLPEVFFISIISGSVGVLVYFVDRKLTKFSSSLVHPHLSSSRFRGMMDVLNFKDLLKNFSSFAFLFTSIVASFYEEILFRGLGIFLLFRYFHINLVVSVILIALLFGIYHIFLSKMAILPKFVAGLILGYLYIITDHIFYPIVAHLIWNVFIWKAWKNAYRNFLKVKNHVQVPEQKIWLW
ncbi:MAG: CPBP family intramembrane glutamic endopeptidase [Acidobacteriota bacterium]